MKLIVQIPCYNEEHTLPQTVRDIPRSIPRIDNVEILIIDDGSTDRKLSVARELGVDIIVNADGDNQYSGWDIPDLIQPILDGTADLVVGGRKTGDVGIFLP